MSRKVFLIAGEASGDALGASLIRALKSQAVEDDIRYVGIGGPLMEAEGLKSFLPMDELCVIGIFEILSQIPRLLRLVSAIVEEIEMQDPDIVITIDLPDFNFLVGQRLKKRAQSRAKLLHYVAPTVWAWREKRAQFVSGFLDGIMCLFPFEAQYFEKYGLPAEFVGHPLVEHKIDEAGAKSFKEEYQIRPDETVIGLFFGSRLSEIKSLSSTLKETVDILAEQYPNLVVLAPTLPQLELNVRNILLGWNVEAIIVSDPVKKWEAFAACDYALAVSGTVGLELSYMKIPHVIGYKVNVLTWLVLKFLVKSKYAHLTNILLDREVVPECLQYQFTSKNLSRALLKLMKMEEARNKQAAAFDDLRQALAGEGNLTPSEKAAAFVMRYMTGLPAA